MHEGLLRTTRVISLLCVLAQDSLESFVAVHAGPCSQALPDHGPRIPHGTGLHASWIYAATGRTSSSSSSSSETLLFLGDLDLAWRRISMQAPGTPRFFALTGGYGRAFFFLFGLASLATRSYVT